MQKIATRNKILLPLDGSDRSWNTIRYLAKTEPFHTLRVVLLHVFSAVPESYWDLEKQAASSHTLRQVRSWEFEREKFVRLYMDQARQFLVKSGFQPDAVEIRIQRRKAGVARDILNEARKGYKAVIARRRGFTSLREIVLGSVATKLLQKLSVTPLIMAGRKSPGYRILIGVDGSENALRAVDFVGSTLGGYGYKVCLLHVVRGKANPGSIHQGIYAPSQFTQTAKKEIEPTLQAAKAKLFEAGFGARQVSSRIVTGAYSRAAAICEEAKRGDYGTIVLGRRGLSRVQQFLIGRVTNKVIHLAKDRTVWVVR